MGRFEVFRCHGLCLTLKERLLPLSHHFAHLENVILHLFDELVNLADDSVRLRDKLVNTGAVPRKLLNSILEALIHRFDSLLKQRLFDGE